MSRSASLPRYPAGWSCRPGLAWATKHFYDRGRRVCLCGNVTREERWPLRDHIENDHWCRLCGMRLLERQVAAARRERETPAVAP